MKVICRYSGIQFRAEGFGKLSITSQHPFLDTPLITLVSKVFPLYVDGSLSEPETRLLFVALLKHSDLVTFNHHAAPSLRTIHANMQILLKTLDWSLSRATVFSLPRYVVNRENCTLKNIGAWINSWYEARDNWLERQQNTYERNAFLIRQEALEKLISAPYRKVEDYAAKLGKWCMDASGAHPDRHQDWIAIFKLREPEVFKADKDEIADLLDWLDQHLDAVNSSIAQKALAHIRRIAYKNNAGILYGLDEFEEETQQLVIARDQGTPFVMLSPHERMLRATAQSAPAEEPVETNFAKRLDYLREKARWNVAQQLKEKLAANTQETEKAAAPFSIIKAEKAIEDKTIIDPAFDDADGSEDAEGTYEEVSEDIVLEALNKMNEASSASASTQATQPVRNNLLEEI